MEHQVHFDGDFLRNHAARVNAHFIASGVDFADLFADLSTKIKSIKERIEA